MRRILYLSRGGAIGGSQRQLYYVVTHLRNGYEPMVVCPKNGQFVNALRSEGIEVHVLPVRSWRKFPAALLRYRDAERIALLARRCEAALVHSSDLWLSGYMLHVSGRLGIPSVLHMRTTVRPADIHKHRCQEATKIIAISRRIRRNLLCAGIQREKITRIHDSVDLSMFRPEKNGEVLRRDFSSCGEVLVGMAGRIDQMKRQSSLLEAAAQIIRRCGRKTSFFVIGEVHHPEYFEKLRMFVKEKGLSRDVFFTGRRDDMPQVLNSLDIVVSCSGGSVMFEAAACGKPVISVAAEGEWDAPLAKYLRRRPIVVAVGVKGLTEALTSLIDDAELRRRTGLASRKWAEDSFCHHVMAEKTQRVYDELLS